MGAAAKAAEIGRRLIQSINEKRGTQKPRFFVPAYHGWGIADSHR